MKLTFHRFADGFSHLSDGEVFYYADDWTKPAATRYPFSELPRGLHREVWKAAIADGEEAYAMLMAAKIKGEW